MFMYIFHWHGAGAVCRVIIGDIGVGVGAHRHLASVIAQRSVQWQKCEYF